MDFHGILVEGDLKTDNIKSIDGVEVAEIENSTGKFTLKTELNINGSLSPSAGAVLETDGSGNCSFAPSSVPAGQSILFESDTAITGYTLLTTCDDMVGYITKGSAAGGETGGQTYSGSTWSFGSHSHGISYQSTHTHTVSSVALTSANLPSHFHYMVKNIIISVTGTTGDYIALRRDVGNVYDYTFAGNAHGYTPSLGGTGYENDGAGGSSHNHTTSGESYHNHGGSTGTNTDTIGWRPYGRNLTIQQKN